MQYRSKTQCWRIVPWLPWSIEGSRDMASSVAALPIEAQLHGGTSAGKAISSWLLGPSSDVSEAWVSLSPSTESLCLM